MSPDNPLLADDTLPAFSQIRPEIGRAHV